MVFLQAGNTSKVFDSTGKEVYSGSTGRQGSLEAWLSLDNAFTSLLKPAGYEYDGKQWSKNPGKIDRGIIEKAHNEGLLTDDQYNLILLAAGLTESNNEKSEKVSLFKQVLADIQKSNKIKTQIQVDMANRAWEWIKRKSFNNKIQESKNNVEIVSEINKKTSYLKQRPLEEKYGYPYTALITIWKVMEKCYGKNNKKNGYK